MQQPMDIQATLQRTFQFSIRIGLATEASQLLAQSTTELEQNFRKYSASLAELDGKNVFVGYDGKVLRGSFDHFNDQKAIQVLSAFAADEQIIGDGLRFGHLHHYQNFLEIFMKILIVLAQKYPEFHVLEAQ